MSSSEPVPLLLDPDQRTFLRDVGWDDFEAVLAMRGDRAAPRLAFAHATVELLTPSPSHERIKSILARLVEAWAEESGAYLDSIGSWTLKDRAREVGAEPDECWVVREVPTPRVPDIALEVVWTSGGLDKLAIYAGLGVPEVWWWEDGRLTVHVLVDGRYEARERSELLPTLDVAAMVEHVRPEGQTEAVRRWRGRVRG